VKKIGANPPVGARLRRLAEERLRASERRDAPPAPDENAAHDRSLYELQVHQIELEIQNEELRRVQHELEVALTEYEELYDFAPVGYITLDEKGSILKVNLAGAVMLGTERSHLVGRRFTLSVTANTRPAFQEFLDTIGRDAKGSCDLALVAHAGRQLDVHIDGLREQVGQGQDWRCRAALTDITERKAAGSAAVPADDPDPPLP
jgi:PAS domain S-box-containing protein